MQHYTADDLIVALDWQRLVDALRDGFRREVASPQRAHFKIPVAGSADATLLLMPAWSPGRYIGVKTVNIFPDNGKLQLPSVNSHYLLMSAINGLPIATFDGDELTARRTAAASALAATYLARADATRLLVVGTGRIASYLALAHAAVRPISSIQIWGRDRRKADDLATNLNKVGLASTSVVDLGEACQRADIVSCATLTIEPLIRGEWLQPGTHVDLVGAFTPSMREADDNAIGKASVFVDTRRGATTEAGEIVQAIKRGIITIDDIRGDLSDLASGRSHGRTASEEITVFKSVGCSLEDLVAAEACHAFFATMRRNSEPKMGPRHSSE